MWDDPPPPVQPVIRKTPGVIGGDACIDRTRIPVWLLVEMRQMGKTEDEFLLDYPQLTRAALQAAWDYYDANRAEIDEAIAKQDEAWPEATRC